MKLSNLPKCACGESSGLFMDYGVHRCPMCVARERDMLLEALRPFARMARPDDDPNELACQRGVGCDMTAIFSQDFTAAAAALDGVCPDGVAGINLSELLSGVPDASTIQQCCICYGGKSFPGPMNDALMCHLSILKSRLDRTRRSTSQGER